MKQLSPLEKAVVREIRNGMANAEISQKLGTGVQSVKNAIRSAASKFGITSSNVNVRVILGLMVSLAPGDPSRGRLEEIARG